MAYRLTRRAALGLAVLPVHDWRITGIDVSCGYSAKDVIGPEFTGAAARAAALV